MQPVAVFNSYTRLDKALADRLAAAVNIYFKSDKDFRLDTWRDTAILLGEDWHQTIQEALHQSDAGLLFVSPGFFSRDYIRDNELPEIMMSSKIILPVMVRKVDLQRQDLMGLEKRQIFTLDGASYEECTGPRRSKFEMALYQAIHDRLNKVYANA